MLVASISSPILAGHSKISRRLRLIIPGNRFGLTVAARGRGDVDLLSSLNYHLFHLRLDG